MIRHEDVEKLVSIVGSQHPITSFYLDAHLGKHSLEEQRLTAKNLLRERRLELEQRADIDKHWKKKALADLDRLDDMLKAELAGPHSYRGLAVFISSGESLEQTYRLPQPVRNALIVDRDPYVRPLTTILDEYHRICTVLVDREAAELYEIYMGEILEHDRVFDEVPGKVRVAGWYGLEERRIERHVEDHVHRHYRHVADTVFRLFKALGFDWLVLGAHHEVVSEFEPFLHPYLRERLIGHFHAEPRKTPLKVVLEKTLAIEEATERKEEVKLVDELLERAGSGGLGVVGLDDTIKALLNGQVHTLIVQEEWTVPGVVCRNCGWLGREGEACPVCGSKTDEVEDLVDEMVELAVYFGGRVEHVFADSKLKDHGHIGALLRFRV